MKDSEINEAQRHILDVPLSLATKHNSAISARKLCDLSSIVLEHLLEGIHPAPEGDTPRCPKCAGGDVWFDDSGVGSGIPSVAVCAQCQNRWAP